MKAEILCVGTELLLGDIVNTNAAYIAKELALLGIDCYHQSVVGDNPQRLKEGVELALSRADMVITSGGLGPTYDDLTKETIAEHFGRTMELHQPSMDMLNRIFQRSGRPMTENNIKQAMMPVGAIVLENDRGTANGLALEGDGKVAIMMPGPPKEMIAMFERQVKPYLAKFSDHVLVSANIHFFGMGESQLEEHLHDYMMDHQNPTVAPYAKEGEVLLRVTGMGKTVEEAEAVLAPVISEICEKYPDYIYGVNSNSLQEELVHQLVARGRTIATAESCTGGLVSHRITQIDGASAVFDLGICTYANEMKEDMLGVSKDILEKHGAVSGEVALEMARHIREKAVADYGLSTTGIAGPTGGTPDKPVGLVYIAISHKDGEEVVRLDLNRSYGEGRLFIQNMATSNALAMALRTIRPTFAYKG